MVSGEEKGIGHQPDTAPQQVISFVLNGVQVKVEQSSTLAFRQNRLLLQ